MKCLLILCGIINIGVNFWPHEDVVIKADIQQQDGIINDDGFNLGVGYQF
jgi:hypothetical protein